MFWVDPGLENTGRAQAKLRQESDGSTVVGGPVEGPVEGSFITLDVTLVLSSGKGTLKRE